MVGLVIAAHGRLAEELLATAEQIVGPLPAVAVCSLSPGTSPESVRDQLRAAVESVDAGDGVLVLADLFGGTPCRESLLLLEGRALEVVAGVNLPMILKASSLRGEPRSLPEMAEELALHTRRHITWASALLREAHERTPS